MSELINTKYSVNTKLTQEMIAAKQSPYYSYSAVETPSTDVVEIQSKDNQKLKKWGKIGAAIGAVALAAAGIIFGKKKLDAKKLEKLEAEARKLAEEARVKAEQEAKIKEDEALKKAQEKAKINAEKQAELKLQQEAKLKSERAAEEKAKQLKIEHNKEILKAFETSNKYNKVLTNIQLYQYGKNGIPLKYSRDSFLTDLKTELETLPKEQRAELEKKFNIRLNETSFNEVGVELEGIPIIPENIGKSESEQNLAKIIKNFTRENEVILENKEEKEVLDAIIQEIPEFTAIIGKKQHSVHQYSVDIHTLKNLSSNLSNIRSKGLDQESQIVLKYSTLLHDLGKLFLEDYKQNNGHADRSVKIAKQILERMDLQPEIKTRILKQIEHHHWFEKYNKGERSAQEVVDLFGNKQDISIAEIMAKSDLQNVNNSFHYQCMNIDEKDIMSAEKLFDEKMQTSFGKIDDIMNKKIAKEKGLIPDKHGIMPISCDEEFFEVMDKLHNKRFRTIYTMGHVQGTFEGPRILEGSSLLSSKDYVKDIPDKMSALPAYIGVNNGSSNTNYELYKEINTFLSKNRDVYMSPIGSGVQIWSEEANTLLKDYLVNMDSETAKDFIRVIDYSLKEVDKEFGKFDGIVYRNGHFAPDGGQFFSASKKHDLTLVGDKSEFHVIRTKNGHKINDFQEKYYHVHEDEAEVLLPRDGKYREITAGDKYQEERLKLAQDRYEMFKRLDQYDVERGKTPEYNLSFEDVLARTHIWEEI